jgi:hypothetical protein
MNISDALSWLNSHGALLRIHKGYRGSTSASVYIRNGWSVRVRSKGCESLEALIIRLALKAQMQEQFKMPPPKKPESKRTKRFLKRIDGPLHVN